MKPYERPQLTPRGSMTAVTRKSGSRLDFDTFNFDEDGVSDLCECCPFLVELLGINCP